MQALPSPPKLSIMEWSICKALYKHVEPNCNWTVIPIKNNITNQLTKLLNEIFSRWGSISMKAPYVVLSTSSRRADLLAGIRYSISSSYLIFSACSDLDLLKGLRENLLWSLHMSTTYPFRPLNIRKKIAVCSVKSFVAKVNKPNGPNLPLIDAFASEQSSWGSTAVRFKNSASCSPGNSKTTSTSAFFKKWGSCHDWRVKSMQTTSIWDTLTAKKKLGRNAT